MKLPAVVFVIFFSRVYGDSSSADVLQINPELSGVPGDEFEKYLQTHEALLRSDREDHQIITTLNQTLSLLLKKIGSLAEQISHLKNFTYDELSKTNANLASINGSLTTVQNNLKTLDARVTTINNTILTLESKQKATDLKIANITNQMSSVQAKLQQTDNHLVNLNNTLSTLQSKFQQTDVKINTLDSSLNNVQAQLQQTNAKVTDISNALNAIQGQLRQTDAKANEALSKYQTCITSVRFGPMVNDRVWKGPGSVDTKSFVLTGVTNWNQDDYVDTSHKRRFEILQGGAWKQPEWS